MRFCLFLKISSFLRFPSISLFTIQYLSVLSSISSYLSVSLHISQYLSVAFNLSLHLSVSLIKPQYLSYFSITLHILPYLSVWWRIPLTFNIFLYSCRTKASWDYYNHIKGQELASANANNTNNKQSQNKNNNHNKKLNNWIITSLIRRTLVLLISLFPSPLKVVCWCRRCTWTT